MTPDQQIKESFRFTSLQGNPCEVQLLDDTIHAKVVNLNNKEQFKILTWQKAYELLNDHAIKTISGAKRNGAKPKLQRPSKANSMPSNGWRENNSLFGHS